LPTSNINSRLSAIEVSRRCSDPDAGTIVESMAMTNTLLQELPATEANEGTTHTFLQRTRYPRGSFVLYDEGIDEEASETKPLTDYCGMLEGRSVVDIRKLSDSGDASGLLNGEAQSFLMGMGEHLAEVSVYGNRAADPRLINGFATRLNKLGLCDWGKCVDSGLKRANPGGTSVYTSIYLCAAGTKAVHLIYPKGSPTMGVSRTDAGVQYVTGSNGKQMRAHVDEFSIKLGIAIENQKALIRICNVPQALTRDEREKLMELILREQLTLTQAMTSPIVLCNQAAAYEIQAAAREKQVVLFAETDPWGRPVEVVNGMRVRRQDSIMSTEEEVK
jgi:hypothetical protein